MVYNTIDSYCRCTDAMPIQIATALDRIDLTFGLHFITVSNLTFHNDTHMRM